MLSLILRVFRHGTHLLPRRPPAVLRGARSRSSHHLLALISAAAIAIMVPLVTVASAAEAAPQTTAAHSAAAASAARAAQAAAAAPGSVTAPADVPAPPSGWSTVFNDDFNGSAGGGPSGSWEYDTGPGSNFGTGEIETMTNSSSNVHLDGNGNLDITALGSGNSWTSGRIQTTTANVGAPAGGELEVTASIEQPNPSSGSGYWPAFWMLGPGQWPENGEVDILEDVNALSEHSGTFHCGTDPGGPCNETTGIGSGLQGCSGCQTGYHTYTAIINRTNTSDESITWYLDGTQFFQVTEAQVGAATWQAAVDHNFSIILDLAMGGSYPDDICNCTAPTGATTSGSTMSVAYVAAYQTSGSAPSGGAGPVTSGMSGKCLDDYGGSSANGTIADLYDCNGTAAQNWTAAGGTLQASGKCLDIIGSGSTADGTLVDLWDCNGGSNQKWTAENGELVNPASGKCLDDPGFSTTNGTQLDIWDCNGGSNQTWSLPGA
jgi:Ricin-type beta-trefoil lectin domain/Glycosyl hydrolases family 16